MTAWFLSSYSINNNQTCIFLASQQGRHDPILSSCFQLNSVGIQIIPYLWQRQAQVHYDFKSSISPFRVHTRGSEVLLAQGRAHLPGWIYGGVLWLVLFWSQLWGSKADLEGWSLFTSISNVSGSTKSGSGSWMFARMGIAEIPIDSK